MFLQSELLTSFCQLDLAYEAVQAAMMEPPRPHAAMC